MDKNRYIEYELTSELLCIGERTKKGTFRPCVKTIPFSTITGALREKFSRSDIYAVGKFASEYLENIDEFRNIHVYSPRYIIEDVTRLPLKIEFLTGVKAHIYLFLREEEVEKFCQQDKNKSFDIVMGAFKTKGFGICHLEFLRIIEDSKIVNGGLQTRIPDPEIYPNYFGIKEVKKPIYGYLFEPTNNVTGKYIKSIFEGSLVEGYDFLVEEVQI